MSQSSTKQILRHLCAAALREWREQGETIYADWFEKTYCDERWDGWHGTASGVPGTASTNNPMEGYNKAIKGTVSAHLCCYQPCYL